MSLPDSALAQVSVIVPVYNGASHLSSALDSLLAQDPPVRLEIIVVNDGSTDETARIATEWGRAHGSECQFRFLEQANAGPGAARNRGIRAACGTLIGFLDSDDLWPRDALAANMSAMQTSSGAAVVLGLARAFSVWTTADRPADATAAFRFLNVGAGLYTREVFASVGLFAPELRGSEDVDWYLRARDAGFVLHSHDGLTLWHRRHPHNMTRGQSLSDLDFHRALKNSLDRRRRGAAPPEHAPFEAKLID